jgi:hypothetical protein
MKSTMKFLKTLRLGIVALTVTFTIGAVRMQAVQQQQAAPPPMQGQPSSATLMPEQLQQLVASASMLARFPPDGFSRIIHDCSK